jgi:predicted DCC family thiol-disulfide oxidoreductase YuxK
MILIFVLTSLFIPPHCVQVEGDRAWTKSDAILRIAAGLSVTPLPLLAILGFPVPGLLRDWVYDAVANNRYSFMGQRDVCRLSNAGFEDRFIVH